MFFPQLLRPSALETPQVTALLSRLIFDAAADLNLRMMLSLVASLTFTRQGAASALRALVREKLPAALECGDLEAAGRALLVVRELGLEAAARQPHFAALSYADWWQVGADLFLLPCRSRGNMCLLNSSILLSNIFVQG